MKKMMALLLTLSMLLAAIPATAETEAAGTWYVIMMGMTAGTMELNADGTCAVTAFSDGEKTDTEGAWSQDGDKLTVNVNNSTLPLTRDGDQLLFDAEGLAALGLDAASMGSPDMDLSVLSGLIQISREPGKITMAEWQAYQENGALPEGKTEEDMQALQAEMFSSLMLLMGGLNAGTDGFVMPEEGPAPELTVAEENFYVRESYGTQEGVYIAKVQNNNDVPAYISGGTLTMRDADGSEVGTADYLSASGSCYLDPGETTFVSIVADVNEGASVDSFTADLQSSSVTYQTPDTALAVSGTELRVEEGYETYYYATATVTNATDSPMAHICAIIAVRDSEGRLLNLVGAGLYQNELAPGSTVTLVDSLDSRAVDYCAQNGLKPDQVEAYAWIESY